MWRRTVIEVLVTGLLIREAFNLEDQSLGMRKLSAEQSWTYSMAGPNLRGRAVLSPVHGRPDIQLHGINTVMLLVE